MATYHSEATRPRGGNPAPEPTLFPTGERSQISEVGRADLVGQLLANPHLDTESKRRLESSPWQLTAEGVRVLRATGLQQPHLEVILLQYVAGLSAPSIGEVLGYTAGRIRSLGTDIRRAFNRVDPRLGDSRNAVAVQWLMAEQGWCAAALGEPRIVSTGPSSLADDPVPNRPLPPLDLDQIDADLFDPRHLAVLKRDLATGRHVKLIGPTGTLKSTLVRYAAQLIGRPVYMLPCSGGTEDKDFFGNYQPTGDRSAVWVPGYLPVAAREGAVLLLDEANFANAAHLSALHSVIDTGIVQLRTFAQADVPCRSGFCIAATANVGSRYAGTQASNIATDNRFRFIACGYPQPIHEVRYLERLGLATDLCGFIVAVANQIRTDHLQLPPGAQYRSPLSLRDTQAWAAEIVEHAQDGQVTAEDILDVAHHVWLYKVLPEQHAPSQVEALLEIVRQRIPAHIPKRRRARP